MQAFRGEQRGKGVVTAKHSGRIKRKEPPRGARVGAKEQGVPGPSTMPGAQQAASRTPCDKRPKFFILP